jgi:hypothetical protein
MSTSPNPDPIETLAELLVQALELENESAERYQELAESMEVHHTGPAECAGVSPRAQRPPAACAGPMPTLRLPTPGAMLPARHAWGN